VAGRVAVWRKPSYSMKPLAFVLLAGSAFHCGDAHAEWTATVYTGVSHTFASDLYIQQSASASAATFRSVPWASHPFTQGGVYVGLRISYFPQRASRLGGFVEYTHYKMYAETVETVEVHGRWNGAPVAEFTALNKRVQHLEISHGVNMHSLGAEYRWNPTFQLSRWRAHVGAGALVYLPHAEGVIDSIAESSNYQYAGAGGQIFGGTALSVYRHIALMIEGKFDIGSLDVKLNASARRCTRCT
jgi:hypothetical protein